MTPPKWNDDEALAAWVNQAMPAQHVDYLFEEALPTWRPDVPMSWESFEAQEREALAAARGGNFRLLAYLLDPDPDRFTDGKTRPVRLQRLSRESEVLIASRLRGKFKVKKGAPKQPVARRRARTPVYAAADEVAIIHEILLRQYPMQRGIRDRAIAIAAKRAGIPRRRLFNHLKSKRRLHP
jgi:DNA primase